jgi:soluble lytic murein transglycosylase-like protein
MIKEVFICLALLDMSGIENQKNICNNMGAIYKISDKYKIESDLYVSMMWIESNFKSNIVSYTGKACGISQVVPKWTRPKMSCKELNENTKAAMEQGARIYSIFKKYGGRNLDITLCAYNQGYRCKGEKPPKTPNGFDPEKTGMQYASKVKKFRKRLKKSIRKQKKKFKIYRKKFRRAIDLFLVYNKP